METPLSLYKSCVLSRATKGSFMEQLQLSKSNSNASLHELPITQNQRQDQAAIKIQQAFKKFVEDKPEMPECYEGKTTHYKYPISAPEKSDKFVFVGNRDNMLANWYRIGAKIDKYAEALGNTTMSVFSDRNPKVFKAEDHNINLPDLSSCSDEALRLKLRELGLSEEGRRVELFKRLVDSKEAENQELIPDRIEPVEHDRATRRINKTALLLILGLMITAAATKKRYGTLSPRGIWRQIRQTTQLTKQKVRDVSCVHFNSSTAPRA